MFLNYLALTMIVIMIVGIYFLFLYIHELPYEAAKHRGHPHADAIFVACWISLFTMHALWPIIFIWALTHSGKEQPALAAPTPAPNPNGLPESPRKIAELEARIMQLETQVVVPKIS